MVTQQTLKTRHIQDALTHYAQENELELSACDFSILHVDTYVKDNATGEFELVEKDILPSYLNKDRILNEHIEFHQLHSIKIFPREKNSLKLEYKIDFGEFSTEPKIILSPKSRIDYKSKKPQEILLALFKEFNKIKAYNHILINMFDTQMKTKLKAFVKYLYLGKFQKNLKLPLFNGIEPVITRGARLLYRFLDKETNSQVIEVDENEVLIEYLKPIFGLNGLNAFGEEISALTSNNENDLQVEVDSSSIDIKEDANKKVYLSKKKGFVHLDEKILTFDNKIKMQKLSRNNEAIASEEENNIEVIISQNDTTQDSVGEGVELVSEIIHINGHVGAKSVLEAVDLKIEGATHQDSKQFAKHAEINRHKGTLRCHKAKVKLLEGGEIHASSVDIETVLSGAIYAKDVTIMHVKSNLKVFASHSITIRLVSGEDNLFKINYRDIPILSSEMTLIDRDIDNLKYELEEASRHKPHKVSEIQKTIKDFQDKKSSIKNSYKDAKISIEKPFLGLNNIIFTIDEENEIIFKTDAKTYEPFYLQIEENKITLHPVNKSITIE